jgi:DNA-binding transcriptional ArsR family regulator
MKLADLQPEKLNLAANMLKAIAHPLRIAILNLLENGEKLSVTEIHIKLGIDQASASHHLGILKDKGILLSKREGKNTFYILKHPDLSSIIDCLSKCQ